MACVQFPGASGSPKGQGVALRGARGRTQRAAGQTPLGAPLPRACGANWAELGLPWLTCSVEKDSEAVSKFSLHCPLSLPGT